MDLPPLSSTEVQPLTRPKHHRLPQPRRRLNQPCNLPVNAAKGRALEQRPQCPLRILQQGLLALL
ncbi:hypothetical protein EON64_12645 [archaeon]|nr:MAG: hypothetical protein EON64_12645 [archaeon]